MLILLATGRMHSSMARAKRRGAKRLSCCKLVLEFSIYVPVKSGDCALHACLSIENNSRKFAKTYFNIRSRLTLSKTFLISILTTIFITLWINFNAQYVCAQCMHSGFASLFDAYSDLFWAELFSKSRSRLTNSEASCMPTEYTSDSYWSNFPFGLLKSY